MKIRLIKKMVKSGKIDGLKNRKYLNWKVKKLNKKAWNMVKAGNCGNAWDNLNDSIDFYSQLLFRI